MEHASIPTRARRSRADTRAIRRVLDGSRERLGRRLRLHRRGTRLERESACGDPAGRRRCEHDRAGVLLHDGLTDDGQRGCPELHGDALPGRSGARRQHALLVRRRLQQGRLRHDQGSCEQGPGRDRRQHRCERVDLEPGDRRHDHAHGRRHDRHARQRPGRDTVHLRDAHDAAELARGSVPARRHVAHAVPGNCGSRDLHEPARDLIERLVGGAELHRALHVSHHGHDLDLDERLSDPGDLVGHAGQAHGSRFVRGVHPGDPAGDESADPHPGREHCEPSRERRGRQLHADACVVVDDDVDRRPARGHDAGRSDVRRRVGEAERHHRGRPHRVGQHARLPWPIRRDVVEQCRGDIHADLARYDGHVRE